MGICIRQAVQSDEPQILEFLDEHWRAGHVFTRQPELFRWQHASSESRDLNCFLATGDEVSGLAAFLGFIPLKHFDRNLPRRESFLAIWKVREDVRAPGLGVTLLNRLLEEHSIEWVCSMGLSRMVIPIYQALGFTVGTFEHHVLLNRQCEEFRIAGHVTRHDVPDEREVRRSHQLLTMTSAEQLLGSPFGEAFADWYSGVRPAKSPEYFASRYLRHPVYDYRLTWLLTDGEARAACVWRKVAAAGSAVLRIVDFLGDECVLPQFAGPLQTLLVAEGAEYLDCYQYGLETDAFAEAGFIDRRESNLIIPNYFEPFEQKNVELEFAHRHVASANTLPIRLARGDSDQDRPNVPGQLKPNGQAVAPAPIRPPHWPVEASGGLERSASQ